MVKIKLSKFEYDYLIAQREVDTQKVHMDAMIRRGYFKSLEPFFVHEDYRSRPDGKLHYVLIGTIRDHLQDFEIEDGTVPNPEDFTPSGYITTHSDKRIVEMCISLLSELCDAFGEYLDYIGLDREDDPFGYRMSYFHIVQHLLLWGTYHGGGTSTMEKCREMGFDPYKEIVFSTLDKDLLEDGVYEEEADG